MDTKVEVNDDLNTNGANEPTPVQDIDPRTWLQSQDELIIGRVKTRAGFIKIAALTEAETDKVRKAAERPINPGKPQLGNKIDLKRLRTNTACESINKANAGVPGYQPIVPNELERKLSGEITSIVNQISKLSGYTEEEEESLTTFLQVS